MTLDNATMMLLQQMAAAGGKPLHEGTPDEARALGAAMADLAGPPPVTVRAEDHSVPTSGGRVPVRVLLPQQPARGIIVYYHGGGWVIGSIDEYDTLARKLAERTSCAVVNVEYRLAPEHRYPAAVDDSYAALEWAAVNNEKIAGKKVPLFVAGDSAGGNLAAVMALRSRDRGGPAIALQVLIYPVTDADFERTSYTDPENQLLLTREAMVWFWDHYVPDGVKRLDPDASPLRAFNFKDLPPAVILTAEHDVLRDEGEAYAECLKQAGVPVDCKRYEGQTHGFFSMIPLPGSERGFQHVIKAIRAAIAAETKRQPALSAH
ncbi:MAG: alpha/beta hydrolase [Dehalococcoidia bacterium]|nr:alpha/beta hydrolase [Dehalococcoidia bacterium]MCB9484548.1 alpha/beta hydrolase [Thermoflexaceae bacterium]